MIRQFIKNDCKRFLNTRSLLLLMSLLPVVLLLILSYTMENVVGVSETSSNQDTILYSMKSTGTNQEKFNEYRDFIESTANGTVAFKEEASFSEAEKLVKRQKAVAYIQIEDEVVDYYRSPFNETDSGQRIRSGFEHFFGKTTALQTIKITEKRLHQQPLNAREYFTFATLGFTILYIALVTANMTFQDKTQQTLLRIFLSKAKILQYFLGKVCLGIFLSIYQVLLVFIVSHFILGVDWGNHLGRIILLFTCFGAMSSFVGIFIGISGHKQEMVSGWVLMSAILTGLLGGGLIPLQSLEMNSVTRFLTVLSPLRWLTKASVESSRNILSNNFVFSVFISLLLATLFFLFAILYVQQKKKKGGLIYV